jgi:hypothetical protein
LGALRIIISGGRRFMTEGLELDVNGVRRRRALPLG